MQRSRILITPGDPAGIGPDITIKAAEQHWATNLIVISDPAVLQARASALNIPLNIIECDLADHDYPQHEPGSLRVHPIHFDDEVIAGKLNPAHAKTVIHCLQLAVDACLTQTNIALVTGPVHKANINEAGISFTGHTEFLANACGVSDTVMLFVVDTLKAALLTTHLPLHAVPSAVTAEKLKSVLSIMSDDLQKYFGIAAPRILIAGLNPHAGENGHMGKEEIDIIQPALDKLRQQGMLLTGPLPADTLFTPATLATGDAVLGMYHDQILPVIKHIGFDRAVNMTLGLPIIRTSVDHGTALDMAGTGNAHPGSLFAAIMLALSILQSLND